MDELKLGYYINSAFTTRQIDEIEGNQVGYWTCKKVEFNDTYQRTTVAKFKRWLGSVYFFSEERNYAWFNHLGKLETLLKLDTVSLVLHCIRNGHLVRINDFDIKLLNGQFCSLRIGVATWSIDTFAFLLDLCRNLPTREKKALAIRVYNSIREKQ